MSRAGRTRSDGQTRHNLPTGGALMPGIDVVLQSGASSCLVSVLETACLANPFSQQCSESYADDLESIHFKIHTPYIHTPYTHTHACTHIYIHSPTKSLSFINLCAILLDSCVCPPTNSFWDITFSNYIYFLYSFNYIYRNPRVFALDWFVSGQTAASKANKSTKRTARKI